MAETINNTRIARNTLLLYGRTLLVMIVTLFTSRVVLAALGIDNYGIFNAVSGVVAMFSIISSSLSTSISRFITYELGKGDVGKLQRIFSMSINIQIIISIIVLFFGELLGVWFLNTHMNIAPERITAANWVFQCSLIIMIVGLISVPYNALIIAHEKMSAFAYISIIEVAFKLLVAYLLYISPIDKLVAYSVLLTLVAIIIRILYGIYCGKHFAEARYIKVYEPTIFKEMSGFAGWTFFANGSQLLNTQGVNILINLFFGVALNAARGVAVQVEAAIMRFINDFTVALNPQITKSYAQGNMGDMYNLICRGSKFAFFLLLLISTPFVIEAPFILSIWLEEVPQSTDLFFRLSMVATGIALLGNTGYVGCMATGKPKKYVEVITPIGCLIFIITFVAYKLGLAVTWAYWSVIIVNIVLFFARLGVMSRLFDFPIQMYFKKVLARIIPVVAISIIPPIIIHINMDESFLRFILVSGVSIFSSLITVYFVGLTNNERIFIKNGVHQKIENIIRK